MIKIQTLFTLDRFWAPSYRFFPSSLANQLRKTQDSLEPTIGFVKFSPMKRFFSVVARRPGIAIGLGLIGTAIEPAPAAEPSAYPGPVIPVTIRVTETEPVEALQTLARLTGMNFILRGFDERKLRLTPIDESASVEDALYEMFPGGIELTYIRATTILIEPVTPPRGDRRACSADCATFKTQRIEPDIIVTSSKRRETYASYPGAVSVLDREFLRDSAIVDLRQTVGRFSNLAAGNTGDAAIDALSYSVRGVSGSGAISLYIDDTPVPESLSPYLTNISRIEFVRGARGALHGANSLAGVVKIVTAPPQNAPAYDGAFTVGATRGGGVNAGVEGLAGAPFGNGRGAVSLAGYYQREAGFHDRTYRLPTPGRTENIGERRIGGGRLNTTFDANETLNVSTLLWFQQTNLQGYSLSDNRPDNLVQARLFDLDEPGSDRWGVASLSLTVRSDDWRLKSSTSYFHRRVREAEDISDNTFAAAPIDSPFPLLVSDTADTTSWIQELRLDRENAGPFNFSLGFFYRAENVKSRLLPVVIPAEASSALTADSLLVSFDARQRQKEASLYGDVNWRVAPRMTLRASARAFFTAVDSERAQAGAIFEDVQGDVAKSQEDFGVAPSFSAHYEYSEPLSLYGSIRKGFRFGGVNFPAPERACRPDIDQLGLGLDTLSDYETDETWTYEIGFKYHDTSSGVRLSLAGYLVNWNDLQRRFFLRCGFPLIANTGKIRNMGFDLDAVIPFTDYISIDASVGYLSTRRTDEIENLTPKDAIENAPAWTGALGATGSYPLTTNLFVFASVGARYVGESFSNLSDPTDPRSRDRYTLVNVSAGIENDAWRVSLTMDNLLNRIVNLSDTRPISVENPSRIRLSTSRPRTVTLRVARRF